MRIKFIISILILTQFAMAKVRFETAPVDRDVTLDITGQDAQDLNQFIQDHPGVSFTEPVECTEARCRVKMIADVLTKKQSIKVEKKALKPLVLTLKDNEMLVASDDWKEKARQQLEDYEPISRPEKKHFTTVEGIHKRTSSIKGMGVEGEKYVRIIKLKNKSGSRSLRVYCSTRIIESFSRNSVLNRCSLGAVVVFK